MYHFFHGALNPSDEKFPINVSFGILERDSWSMEIIVKTQIHSHPLYVDEHWCNVGVILEGNWTSYSGLEIQTWKNIKIWINSSKKIYPASCKSIQVVTLLYASANISDYEKLLLHFLQPNNQRLNVTISHRIPAFMALKFTAPPTAAKNEETYLFNILHRSSDSNWRVHLNTWRQPFEKINIPWDESFKPRETSL
ncbi:BCR1 [Lepeophtheirus salmonis]|uniref:BCR1 n=1 Tax=Lepeophtheirus salmonis TaxID=72036 RepID=A0A7R8H4I3_LEPSM|nr:BCR1 [Lepeophtheirus salmonis]CAF2860014.1 BCR1 [Lepeophtheirus salmonis]